jgi:hypothetical protein
MLSPSDIREHPAEFEVVYPLLKHTLLWCLICLKELDVETLNEQVFWKIHG